MIIAFALGVVLGTQAAAAGECQRETPLPADVRLIPPGPEVSEAVARFAGAWLGAWLDNEHEALCHTLVVEEVLASSYARVIYSVGTYAGWNARLPNFWRATGWIIQGQLRFQLPVPGGPELAYRFAGETLSGTFKGEGRVTLTRVADLSQVGCGPQAVGLPPAPPAAGGRDRLTAAELLASPEASIGPVHNAYYMPVGQAEPARHAVRGTLTVPTSTLFRGRQGCAGLAELLTGFEVAFFTQGEHLVPADRGILPPSGIILSPGRVWSEPGDGGFSRASFPLVLTDPHVNEAHHGLTTFLYDDTQVSALRVQVVQETAPHWNKYDGWAQISIAYTPGSIPNEDGIRSQFAAELQHPTPIQPWSALPVSSGAPWLERFDGDTAPADLKASGLIIDGVIYLRGCETRTAPYPYCQQMRHGVYSVTKSLGAAVALLRLAQKYGDEVFDLKIKDYVTVTAPHDGWERVTFKDALNMATGVGESWPQRDLTRPHGDEDRFCRKVRFWGKIPKLGVRNSMAYRCQHSRKSNFATEPFDAPGRDPPRLRGGGIMQAVLPEFVNSPPHLHALLLQVLETQVATPRVSTGPATARSRGGGRPPRPPAGGRRPRWLAARGRRPRGRGGPGSDSRGGRL